MSRRTKHGITVQGGAVPGLPGVANVHYTELRQHVSPLPAPNDLAQYEQIRPGTTERLLSNWETEAKHRRTRDVNDQTHRHRFDWVSLLVTFSMGGGGLAVAAYCAAIGQPWVGGVAVTAVFGTGIMSLITRRRPPPAA